MKTLKLADGLILPLTAVTEKLAWLGRTGSGKTYGAMKLAELMLDAGAQIGVIDPVGVWRGLRVPAKKGGTSFDVVVFGGLSGDLPLDPGAGELVADLVTDRGLSFVLDVSQMIPSEQQRLVRAFADRFFHRRKAAPAAVHLFMEECQEFIPENPSGQEAQTLGVMQRLWKLGRNFGIGGSLISQRPQEIAKKALNMSGTLFAFQMTGPQERKAIRAWVADHGVATDIEAVLQKLTTGEPHVESPTFLAASKTVQILPRVTADLSSTPEVGAATAARRPLTPIDVEQLKASMAATIEKAKADDPKELKRQVADLRAQLSAAQKVGPSSVKSGGNYSESITTPKAVEILTDADRDLLAKTRTWLVDHRTFVDSLIDGIDDRLAQALQSALEDAQKRYCAAAGKASEDLEEFAGRKSLTRILEKLDRVALAQVPGSRPPAPAVRMPAARADRSSTPTTGDSTLGKAERAILTVLAQHLEGCEVGKLTLLSGYRFSGGFRNSLSTLRTAGYMDGSNTGVMRITEPGLAAIGPVPPLPEGDDLRAYWLSHPSLGKCERAVLTALFDHPAGMKVDALCSATGYEFSGGFRNALSTLRTAGLIEGKNTETMRAAAVLLEA